MSENKNSKNLTVRNSTAEFLIFTHQSKVGGIEVRYEKETIWLTQKLMAELFQTFADNIGLHLKNIFNNKELVEGATTENFSVVQKEGARSVRRTVKFYNLGCHHLSGLSCQLSKSHPVPPVGHSSFAKLCH